MVMYDRIAVIYRGHLRTWDYVKDINFKFFESISKEIDYYFITWDLYENPLIEKDFEGRNLIKFLSISKDTEFYQADYGPAWLLNNILPYKKLREKTVSYDAVIDTRPDVILKKTNEFPALNDLSLYVQWIEVVQSLDPNVKLKGLGDICNIMPSHVTDIISQRYKLLSEIPSICHINFYNYCINNSIKPKLYNNFCEAIHVRPQMLELVPDPYTLYNMTHNEILRFKDLWVVIPKEEKEKILEKYNICKEDYTEIQHGIAEVTDPQIQELLERWREIILSQYSPSQT